ncbi:MAG TPA: mandelate racemase/muconate lactonizing enzyme family protein [Geminicoccaceae bacterium]|nr:mandelate racemase/muconate lactonizing enzyme family protein [Geminicoccaceae bacterium]
MAKIAAVRASAHSRPFEGTLVRLGLGANTKRDVVLVRITTDDGTVGWGESHHGQNPTAMAEVVEKGLGSLILGADPLDSEGIWARLARQQVVTHGLGAGSVIALSGIDIALWDLKGKLMGQPVYRLLGGAPKRLRAYAGGLSLGFKPVDELEREVRALVDRGYTAIKLRVGDHPKRDAERVGHIRHAFGDELDIAIDAATRYSQLDIPDVLAYCEKHRVYWLEEPFTPDDIGAYAELRRRTAIPIAAGENHYTRQAFRDLLEARAITIAQADCTKAGGISEVRKIADMAGAWHVWMAPHTSHSVLSAAANVHLLCAIQNGLIYEADVAAVNPFRTDLSRVPFEVVDGHIEPNDRPGLGLEIDEAVLAAHPAIAGPCYIPGR